MLNLYEYVLDNTNDEAIRELAKKHFLSLEIKKEADEKHIAKYFIFTVDENIKLVIDLALTFDFNQNKPIPYTDKMLLFATIFMTYKDSKIPSSLSRQYVPKDFQDMIPPTLTHLYVSKYKDQLLPILDILLSGLNETKESTKNNLFAIRIDEDVTKKLTKSYSFDNKTKKTIWGIYNHCVRNNYLPAISDF